ncbi:MAG: 50S ribosomal protein L1 [Candidatus Marinimicrobia bacterium]|nr:50S ribosomal protein L1 [Candidatus Neomarinimicrobiota bacterium]
MKVSKRVLKNKSLVDKTREYDLKEAIALIKKTDPPKFDETIEAHVNLGVDPRHADQNVRGTVYLPNGTGKKIRVLVLTKSKIEEAKEAGADYFGFEEYIEKIKNGWLEFDAVIATPDVMSEVGKLGRILGPRGLMPNPKSGTVTNDVAKAVNELKAGRIEVRVDKYGIIHAPVGKRSFTDEQLEENIRSLVSSLIKMKPPAAKGAYLKKITLASTMGPGVTVKRESVVS